MYAVYFTEIVTEIVSEINFNFQVKIKRKIKNISFFLERKMETNKIDMSKTCIVKFEAYLHENSQKITVQTEGTCSQSIMKFFDDLSNLEKTKSKGSFF